MLIAMVIEDNAYFRVLLRDMLLSQYPSMDVVLVGSGEGALEKVAAFRPDLVFMDIHLPGETGFTITRRIKASYPDIPVLIITNYDLPEYREAATTCGASCFIAKDTVDRSEIGTLVKCHWEAKDNGRKPGCVELYK